MMTIFMFYNWLWELTEVPGYHYQWLVDFDYKNTNTDVYIHSFQANIGRYLNTKFKPLGTKEIT